MGHLPRTVRNSVTPDRALDIAADGNDVAALAAADRRFDPGGADSFAQRLGGALDDRRIGLRR